jgi:hypothetical protein
VSQLYELILENVIFNILLILFKDSLRVSLSIMHLKKRLLNKVLVVFSGVTEQIILATATNTCCCYWISCVVFQGVNIDHGVKGFLFID